MNLRRAYKLLRSLAFPMTLCCTGIAILRRGAATATAADEKEASNNSMQSA